MVFFSFLIIFHTSSDTAKVKKIYTIDMEDKGNPTHNRNLKEFRFFYNDIWKDIDIHV